MPAPSDLYWQAILTGIVLPALVAGGAVQALVRLTSAQGLPARGCGATALALGYIAGHLASVGWPRWLPGGAAQKLCLVALAATLAAWTWNSRGWKRWLIPAFCLAAAFGFLLWPWVRHTNPDLKAGLAVAALLFAACAAWLSAARGSCALPPWSAMNAVVLVGIGTAVTCYLSGTALFAQLAGVAAAAGAGCWLSGRPSREIMAGAVGVGGALLTAIWVASVCYAEIPGICIAALVAAPVASSMWREAYLQRLGVWQALLLRDGLVALLSSLAVAFAWARSP